MFSSCRRMFECLSWLQPQILALSAIRPGITRRYCHKSENFWRGFSRWTPKVQVAREETIGRPGVSRHLANLPVHMIRLRRCSRAALHPLAKHSVTLAGSMQCQTRMDAE